MIYDAISCYSLKINIYFYYYYVLNCLFCLIVCLPYPGLATLFFCKPMSDIFEWSQHNNN